MVGADKWRNPDEDLPADFDQRRAENYAKLRKPLDPTEFTAQMRAEMAEALADLSDHLPGDKLHNLVRQLAAAGREPAHAGEKLQQQREPQPGSTRLVTPAACTTKTRCP